VAGIIVDLSAKTDSAAEHLSRLEYSQPSLMCFPEDRVTSLSSPLLFCAAEYPFSGVKRTSLVATQMSAFDPRRTYDGIFGPSSVVVWVNVPRLQASEAIHDRCAVCRMGRLPHGGRLAP
jgi:hypothetical protein